VNDLRSENVPRGIGVGPKDAFGEDFLPFGTAGAHALTLRVLICQIAFMGISANAP
tara:strand:- start:10905 stop:11072 length:168 start_codon:yes stop_codon:yes gene_type:complete